MNREEVIALAREANISVFEDNTFADDMYISVLYRFANLVAAAEREACAKVCDGWAHADGDQCAEAIRARGKQ